MTSGGAPPDSPESTGSSQRAAGAAAQEARQAGRGVLYIAFAKFYFMVAGAVIEFRLPALLGQTVFGAYGVVASVVSPLNNVLVTGTIQAVSRFTAQTPGRARALQAAGLRMHLLCVGLPLAILFIAGAPVISYFLHDQTKVGPLMLAGLIVLGYSFYAVFVGTANGLKQFHKQAFLDICFATLRATGILGLAVAGFGLYGAVGGWVGAVCLILGIAAVVVGLPRHRGEGAPIRPFLQFFAPVALYLIFLNLIMFIDQLLLKRLSTDWFAAMAEPTHAGLAKLVPHWLAQRINPFVTPAHSADAQVGYYRAVQNLARLSYQAIIAATFVIFPLISRSTFEADRDTTRRYIRTTLRYSLIFSAAIAVVFAANPRDLLDIPYASDYARIGAPALMALALGNVAFSIFVIAGTILNGAGKIRDALLTAVVTLTLAALANALVIPRTQPGTQMLLACASATASAMVLGAALAGGILARRFGAFIPVLTVVRVVVAAAAAIGVGRVIVATSPLFVLGEAVVIGVVFLLVLIGTRELTRADLGSLTRILRKDRS